MSEVIQPPVKYLERNKPHQKYYSETRGEFVPGASTIAKIGSDPNNLIRWAWNQGREGKDYRKTRDKAADIGTICHFLIECHLEGCLPNLDDFATNDIKSATVPFQKFLAWWEDQDLAVICPEMQIVSEKYGYGGTIDAPSRDRNGNVVLLDWKTSKGIWEEHIIQLSAYEQLLHEHLEEQVTRRAIIRIGKDPEEDPEIRWLNNLDAQFKVFQCQLALYNARKLLK